MRNRAGVIMAGESNLGLHRKRNEDNFCCYAPPGRKCALAVVADGVGGHAQRGGRKPDLLPRSRRSVPADGGTRRRTLPDAAAVFLRDKIRKINRKVFSRNYFEQVVRPMSSTIVAAVFMPEAVLLASAGDSRMYEFHPADGLVPAFDRSLVFGRIRAGTRFSSAGVGDDEEPDRPGGRPAFRA